MENNIATIDKKMWVINIALFCLLAYYMTVLVCLSDIGIRLNRNKKSVFENVFAEPSKHDNKTRIF